MKNISLKKILDFLCPPVFSVKKRMLCFGVLAILLSQFKIALINYVVFGDFLLASSIGVLNLLLLYGVIVAIRSFKTGFLSFFTILNSFITFPLVTFCNGGASSGMLCWCLMIGIILFSSMEGIKSLVVVTLYVVEVIILIIYGDNYSLSFASEGKFLQVNQLLAFLFTFLYLLVYFQLELYFYHEKENESYKQKKINSAMCKSFIALAYVDIENDVFEEVFFDNVVRQLISSKGRYAESIRKFENSFVSEIYLDDFRQFNRLSTLNKRTSGKKIISFEFCNSNQKWMRSNFIPVEWDGDILKSVLYMVQPIDGEILQLRSQLQTEDALVECARTISSYSDINESINHLLNIIAEYYGAQRSYIFEFDYNNNTVSNTHEYCTKGTPSGKRFFMNVPIQNMKHVFSIFENSSSWIVDGIKNDIPSDSYEARILRKQKVDRLFSAAIKSNDGKLNGFMGVDNPTRKLDNKVFLETVVSFIADEMEKKHYLEKLEELSFKDKMTGAYNRTAYINEIEQLKKQNLNGLGIIFCDVNNLKKTNDSMGHEFGDKLIETAVNSLRNHFIFGDMYRVGGDEFLLIVKNVTKTVFEESVESYVKNYSENPLVSIGGEWRENSLELSDQIKVADQKMYVRKKEFHEKELS